MFKIKLQASRRAVLKKNNGRIFFLACTSFLIEKDHDTKASFVIAAKSQPRSWPQ